MKRIILAALLLSVGIGLLGAAPKEPVFVGTFPAGEIKGPALVGGLGAAADTFMLLVQDGTALPSKAVDGGHIDADSLNYYDQVTSEGGFGLHMRYGGTFSSTNTVPNYNINGIASSRKDYEHNGSRLSRTCFVAFDLSGLTAGDKVEEATLYLNTMRTIQYDFSTGYVAVRLDTLAADYEMLESVSVAASGDERWLATSHDEVNMTGSSAWTLDLDDRDDSHDFGPRGELTYPNDAEFGSGDSGKEDQVLLDFTDPLQQILDNGKYDEQNGWVILLVYSFGSPQTSYAWGAGLSAKVPSGNPAVTVTTSNVRGEEPWGGGGLPFCITYDDSYGEQTGYYEVMEDAGLVFTSNFSKQGRTASFDSLNTANPGEIHYVAHSWTHQPLGDVTGEDIDSELERDFFVDPTVFTVFPDTSLIIDFCYPGGGTYKYSHEAVEKLVDFGYRSARAATQAPWEDGPPGTAALYVTELSWDSPVNMLLLSADFIVWEDGSTERTEAEIKEYIEDKIDYLYTYRGKAAFHSFTHTYFMNKTTPDNIAYTIDLINSLNNIQNMDYLDILNLRDATRIDPKYIASMDIPSADSTTIKASAAIDDSLIAIMGHDNLLQTWIGPRNHDYGDIALKLSYPVYGAWDNDPRDTLTTDDYKLFAESDVSVLDHNVFIHEAYIGLVDSVRAYNPDWIPLIYVWGYGLNVAFEAYAEDTFYGDLWAAAVDNDFFAKTTFPNSEIIWSTGTWPGVAMLNPYAPGLAETFGAIYAKYLNSQDLNRHHVGYFVDWHFQPMTGGEWSWATDFSDSLDMDQNGTPYGDGSLEEAFNIAYLRDFPRAYREAANNPTLLLMPNGNVHLKIATADVYDGGMNENMHYNNSGVYPYGKTEWESAVGEDYGKVSRTRVDPGLIMFQTQHDSIGHPSEALATIARGISCFAKTDKSITATDRRYDFGEIVGAPTWVGSTVTAEYLKDGVTTFVHAVQENYIWQYLIVTSEGDTLSRGGGWPRETP